MLLLSLDLPILFAETAIFCVLLFAFLRIHFLGSQSRQQQCKQQGTKKIPTVSYFPVPVPDFVNGICFLYRFHRDGLNYVQELISKYGTYVEMPAGFGLGTFYAVADPAIAQKILSSNGSNSNYLNKPKEFYHQLFPHELRNGLLTLEHDIWAKHRKVLDHSFSYGSLQAYLQVMNEHGEKLTERLFRECSSETAGLVEVEGRKVDDSIFSATIKIVLQTAMGTDCCSDEESVVIQNCFESIKHITQHRFQNPLLLLEPIWWCHPKRVNLDRAYSTLRELLTKKIRMFREATSKPCGCGCGVDVDSCGPSVTEVWGDGMKARPRPSSMIGNMISSGASDLEIYSEILTLIAAGHDTTANAMTMLLFHLACNPECQAMCREEVSKILGSRTMADKTFSLQMSDLAQMKYLERCIFESLRITPTVPLISRRLDSPLEIIEGRLRFEKGKAIVISPWAIHRIPDIYPNPENFDPDRFLHENVQKRHPYAYMPFSGGPRNCIGYKYAIMEMKVMLARILHHFDISTGVDPRSVKYFMEISLIPDRDLNIVLKKRADSTIIVAL